VAKAEEAEPSSLIDARTLGALVTGAFHVQRAIEDVAGADGPLALFRRGTGAPAAAVVTPAGRVVAALEELHVAAVRAARDPAAASPLPTLLGGSFLASPRRAARIAEAAVFAGAARATDVPLLLNLLARHEDFPLQVLVLRVFGAPALAARRLGGFERPGAPPQLAPEDDFPKIGAKLGASLAWRCAFAVDGGAPVPHHGVEQLFGDVDLMSPGEFDEVYGDGPLVAVLCAAARVPGGLAVAAEVARQLQTRRPVAASERDFVRAKTMAAAGAFDPRFLGADRELFAGLGRAIEISAGVDVDGALAVGPAGPA
jgi:hypothetical protein